MKWWFLVCLLLVMMACQENVAPQIEAINLNLPEEEELRKVSFVSDSKGFLLGGLRYDQDRIFWTEDGGASWQPSNLEFELGKMLFDLLMVNDSVGFATALDGKILKTVDGGQNYSLSGQIEWWPVMGVAQASDSVIVVVGGVGYSEGMMWRTENLGESWSRVDTFDFELRDIQFVSDEVGFASGYGAILKTIDGGKNWTFTPARNEFFSAMSFLSTDVGYAVGRTGTILKTEDGGESWDRLRNGNTDVFSLQAYNDVWFEDENHGYIVGDRGLFLTTEDGGRSWKKTKWPTKDHLFSISVKPNGKILVAGDKGQLWRMEP